MTYRQLQNFIGFMDDDQKDCNVTVKIIPGDQFYGLTKLEYQNGDDVLDNGHPYIVVVVT